MSDKLKISYTKAMTLLTCRYKYNLKYNEHIIPKGKSYAMSLGSIVHKMLQEINTNKFELNHNIEKLNLHELAEKYLGSTSEESRLCVFEAYKLILGYMKKYQDSNYKVVSAEVIMEADFGICILYTRLDGITRIYNDYWRHEYKTTNKIDNAYLKGLKKGLQTGIAHLILNEVTKVKFRGTIFDLIVKTKVPQYQRNPIMIPWRVLKRTELTLQGIVRDIKNGDFYPSGICYKCNYEPLCTATSPEEYNEVLNNFFTRKEDKHDEVEQPKTEAIRFKIKC